MRALLLLVLATSLMFGCRPSGIEDEGCEMSDTCGNGVADGTTTVGDTSTADSADQNLPSDQFGGVDTTPTPDTSVVQDTSGPQSCQTESGSPLCPDGYFCNPGKICVPALKSGEVCSGVASSSENPDRVCGDGQCRPGPLGPTKYCAPPGECANLNASVAPGSGVCSPDKLQFVLCGNDGNWFLPEGCPTVTCGDGTGKQPQECGVDGCQAKGDCQSCFPWRVDSSTLECQTTCTVTGDCAPDAECDSGECKRITVKQVDCDTDNDNPPNSSDTLAKVTINWDELTGWETAAKCDWTCDTDYSREGDLCVNEKQVDCEDLAPENATSVITQVTISFTSTGGWTKPGACQWSCNADYYHETSDDSCINSDMVPCLDLSPANSDPVVVEVEITYSDASGWSDPAICAWNCATGYQDNDNNDTCTNDCSTVKCTAGRYCTDVSGTALCKSDVDCLARRDRIPGSPNGTYQIDPDGDGPSSPIEVYCDMSGGGWTIEAIGFGQWNATHSGWALITASQWSTTAIQQAFIWYYNKHGGAKNLDVGYSATNCCFRVTGGTGEFLHFGPSSDVLNTRLLPANFDGSNTCSGPYNDAFMKFRRGITVAQTVPLPDGTNYFTSSTDRTPSTGTGCTDANNPGFFVRRYK